MTTAVWSTGIADSQPEAAPQAPPLSELPPGSPVPIPKLAGLLLNPPEAAAVIGSARAAGHADMGDKIYTSMSDQVAAELPCTSLSPGIEHVYQGSGFTASRQQFLTGESVERKLIQTVVSFANPEMAARHVANVRASWQACAEHTVDLGVAGGAADPWQVGPLHESRGIVMTSRVQEHGDGWLCQDGIAARNNVVIDVAVCGEDVPDTVVPAYVTAVTAKVHDVA